MREPHAVHRRARGPRRPRPRPEGGRRARVPDGGGHRGDRRLGQGSGHEQQVARLRRSGRAAARSPAAAGRRGPAAARRRWSRAAGAGRARAISRHIIGLPPGGLVQPGQRRPGQGLARIGFANDPLHDADADGADQSIRSPGRPRSAASRCRRPAGPAGREQAYRLVAEPSQGEGQHFARNSASSHWMSSTASSNGPRPGERSKHTQDRDADCPVSPAGRRRWTAAAQPKARSAGPAGSPAKQRWVEAVEKVAQAGERPAPRRIQCSGTPGPRRGRTGLSVRPRPRSRSCRSRRAPRAPGRRARPGSRRRSAATVAELGLAADDRHLVDDDRVVCSAGRPRSWRRASRGRATRFISAADAR